MSDLLSSELYDNSTFYPAFTIDLQNAHDFVLIESPFITSKRMKEILPILIKLRSSGISIIVNTRNPNEHNAEYNAQALVAISALQRVGVKVLYTVKHHRKLAIIDGETLWEGSLNILSQGDSCEIMRRSLSHKLSQDMLNFIDAKQWL